jgi:hypothetical protein
MFNKGRTLAVLLDSSAIAPFVTMSGWSEFTSKYMLNDEYWTGEVMDLYKVMYPSIMILTTVRILGTIPAMQKRSQLKVSGRLKNMGRAQSPHILVSSKVARTAKNLRKLSVHILISVLKMSNSAWHVKGHLQGEPI